ncbi:MAG: hypothetical protein DME87_04950, partial [Verrucomicrobia bacterium]
DPFFFYHDTESSEARLRATICYTTAVEILRKCSRAGSRGYNSIASDATLTRSPAMYRKRLMIDEWKTSNG